MSFGAQSAGVARVEFEAGTGEFNRDIAAAEARYAQTTGKMSDDAIRLSLAQDKLNRALGRYGPESRQAKQATLALRREMDGLGRETAQTTHQYDRQTRSLNQLSRGGLAGTGVFRGFSRSIAFASSTFLGGAGLIYALRLAKDASSNLAEQTDFTRRVFGQSSDEVINYANNALGLARDQALEAASGIGSLLVPLGLNETAAAKLSVQLTKLGVDLASLKNTGVDEALTAIRSGLVGESEPLRRYAVLLSEARVAQVAMSQTGKTSAEQLTDQEKVLARVAIILKSTAIAQGNYADTIGSTANQERERDKNLRNTAILIGDVVRPAYDELLGRVNAYVGDAENQKRIQAEVNQVVRDGEQVLRGLADAIKTVRTLLNPAVVALGGFENAAELAFGLVLLAKLRKIPAAIGLIGPASTRAAATTVASMAAIDAAVAAPLGKVGRLRGALVGLGSLRVTIPIILAITYKDEINGLAKRIFGEQLPFTGDPNFNAGPTGNEMPQRGPGGVWRQNGKPLSAEGQAYWERKYQAGQLTSAGMPTQGGVNPRGGPGSSQDRPDHSSPYQPPADPQATERTSRKPHEFALPYRLELAASKARATTTDRDDLDVYQQQLAFVRRQIASGLLTKAGLLAAYGELASIQNAIDGIVDRGESDVDRRRKESADKARERDEARRAAEQRKDERQDLVIARNKARAALTPGEADDRRVLAAEERLVKRRLAALAHRVRLSNDELRAQTSLLEQLKDVRDQLKRGVAESNKAAEKSSFLEELNRIADDYASNVSPAGTRHWKGPGFIGLTGIAAEYASPSSRVGTGSTIVINQDLRGRDTTQFAAQREARRAAEAVLA